MDFKTLGTVISHYAPLLGSTILSGSPIATVLISLISNLFGVDPKNTDLSDLINKIVNDKDAETKLKQIELDHQALFYSTEVDDRKSAREREESVIKSTGKRDWLLDMIAFIVISGYFVMCSLIIFNKLDSENNQVLYMMFGQLTGGFIMVLSYYFGSSKTSLQ
jgi:hypothetical protein